MKNVYFFMVVLIGMYAVVSTLRGMEAVQQYLPLRLTSSAFENGAAMPREYTCEGKNTPPPISWTQVPAGTKSFVLFFENVSRPWVHWVMYDIPVFRSAFTAQAYERLIANTNSEQKKLEIEQLGRIGVNSWRKKRYGGPCPAVGNNIYQFTLFALDVVALQVKQPVTKAALKKAMRGHVLTSGILRTTYDRRLP